MNRRSRRQKSLAAAKLPSAPSSPASNAGAGNKENDGADNNGNMIMSPTPYWRVAKEKGVHSPPATRSAKKSKNKNKRRGGADDGLVMCFSPPDQKLNAQREKERIERQERER